LEFGADVTIAGLTVLTAALGFAAGRERAGRSLAAFFLVLAVSSIGSAIIYGWQEWLSPAALRWLRTTNVPCAYLVGPLLYRYVIALVAVPPADLMKPLSWHAAPFLIALVVTVSNAAWSLDTTPSGAAIVTFLYHAWVPHGVLYLCFAGWRLRSSRGVLEQVSADEAALHLSWLRVLVAVIGLLWTLAGVERAIRALVGHEWPLLGVSTAWSMVIALYFLAWFGLQQRILVPAGLADSLILPDGGQRSRYAKSGLGEPELAQIADDLSRLMSEQRLYVDSELDLKILSERSGWSPNYISQALNQHLHRNFFEFVNGFRVAAALQRLADRDERRSIVDIAMECGFGSKSTFNTVFKRITGATPSEFRRERAQIPSERARSDV
jgi:AraC-like DNA-binding protein